MHANENTYFYLSHKLNVFEHYGDSLGVDFTQVCVFIYQKINLITLH